MYHYLKYFIFILLFVFGFFQRSFSYFEEKMYCDIGKDKIVISLDNKENYTCNVYIRYVEMQMKKVYRDTLVIQAYVDKKQDLGYWNPLKEEKVRLLNLLQDIRLNIISHMQTFESNLLETSKKYFLNTIYHYQKKLSRTFDLLLSLNDPSGLKYSVLIEEQLLVIENISKAESFVQLNGYIQRYVYLKQEIEGK